MNPALGACLLAAVSAAPAELPISEEDLGVFPPYEFVVYATELSRNFMYQADCERDRYYLDPPRTAIQARALLGPIQPLVCLGRREIGLPI